MVYSIVLCPLEMLVQLKMFKTDKECSDYHNFVAETNPTALISRASSLTSAFKKFEKYSICLKGVDLCTSRF